MPPLGPYNPRDTSCLGPSRLPPSVWSRPLPALSSICYLPRGGSPRASMPLHKSVAWLLRTVEADHKSLERGGRRLREGAWGSGITRFLGLSPACLALPLGSHVAGLSSSSSLGRFLLARRGPTEGSPGAEEVLPGGRSPTEMPVPGGQLSVTLPGNPVMTFG